MASTWLLCVIACLFGAAYGGEVCYPKLGCFNDNSPWGGTSQRPISRLPWSPEKIGVRFLLYTQSGLQELKPDKASLDASSYKSDRPTRFIVPGYLKDNEKWPVDMCKAIWPVKGDNCVVVEWTAGIKTNYPQAANNARVVGANLALMIKFLKDTAKQTTDVFHIIGHSLGAHVAGEAGSRTKKLGRITALDPTEPYFQGASEKVRLDPSDAVFVDVIHTDTLPFNNNLGLGTADPVGHLDFYPNGGGHQPGCTANKPAEFPDLDGIWEGLQVFEACNHLRSYQYYMESIQKPTGFTGYPCSGKEAFEKGECFLCQEDSCPVMGHFAQKRGSGVSKNKYYLSTGDKEPFARYNFRATTLIDGHRSQPGFMYLMLIGKLGKTAWHEVHVGLMTPGASYTGDISAEVDVGEVTQMKFSWNNHIYNPMLPKFGATKIELIEGSNKKKRLFCGTGLVFENAHQTVDPCKV